MGDVILLDKAKEKRPQSICPHCKKTMMMDITPFKEDITKIMQSNCPFCRGLIFVGLLILTNTELDKLYQSIAIVVNALDPKNKLLL